MFLSLAWKPNILLNSTWTTINQVFSRIKNQSDESDWNFLNSYFFKEYIILLYGLSIRPGQCDNTESLLNLTNRIICMVTGGKEKGMSQTMTFLNSFIDQRNSAIHHRYPILSTQVHSHNRSSRFFVTKSNLKQNVFRRPKRGCDAWTLIERFGGWHLYIFLKSHLVPAPVYRSAAAGVVHLLP